MRLNKNWRKTKNIKMGTRLLFLFFLIMILGNFQRNTRVIVSPLPEVEAWEIEAIPTVTPTPYSVQEDIKQVFGKYSDKAFLVLQGKECAENRKLNPEAVNDNTTWGGVGRDWGVFQINDHWQGVSNTAFLKDPRINIRIAWNIFERSGYKFTRWTCGKHYKI
jgi:hypothetical protein